MSSVKIESTYWRWAWIIVFIGAFLRTWQYLFNRSLWNDEALLALNLSGRSFGTLWGKLEHGIVQPAGFLLIEKIFFELLGNTEYALRLWPLLAGIVALLLFPFVARSCSSARAALTATALFALSDRVIYFTSEARQYSSDVAVALAILLIVLKMRKDGVTGRSLLALACLGALSVWFSYSAAFVYASALLVTAGLAYSRREKNAVKGIALACAAWLASGALYCLVSFDQFADRAALVEHWQTWLAPMPGAPASGLKWYRDTVLALVRNPGGFTHPALALFAACIGAFSMARKREYGLLVLLAAPPLLAGAASAVRMYPLFGRMLLFALPGFLLLIALGIDALLSAPGKTVKTAAILLLVFVFISPLEDTIAGLVRPRYGICGPDETRPVLEYVVARRRPDDAIYVHHNATFTCEYYLHGRDIGFIRGTRCRDDSRGYVEEIEARRGNPRVWFIFTRGWPAFTPVRNERRFFVNNLSRIGRMIDCYRTRGGAAYLYDLSRQNAGPAEARDANP